MTIDLLEDGDNFKKHLGPHALRMTLVRYAVFALSNEPDWPHIVMRRMQT